MPDVAGDGALVIIAPVGRDAQVICEQLAGAQLRCFVAASLADAGQDVVQRAAGLIITEEALTAPALCALEAALDAQPEWSDMPILLLLAPASERPVPATRLEALMTRHAVAVLERPVPRVTLVSTARAAVSARLRQYEVRDLIERERAAREDAEAATRVRDEFVANVSHELRTPLQSIMLWSDMLEASVAGNEELRAGLKSIATSASAQGRLIDDLLDMARLLSGTMRIAPAPTEIGPLVESTADIVRPAAIAKRIALDVRVATTNDVAFVDTERMRQIVWNLLNNAVKFTGPGGHVAIAVERERDDVVITVTDTGKGIPPSLLPHVFDRFRQGEQGPTRRQGGLGLGLSIVRHLCELQGGTVEAHSEGEGKGAMFIVRLPASREVPVQARSHHPSA